MRRQIGFVLNLWCLVYGTLCLRSEATKGNEMKTCEEILQENLAGMSVKIPPVLTPHIKAAMKEYAKQYLQEVATKLEPYDKHDHNEMLSQIPYRLMDEIDAQ